MTGVQTCALPIYPAALSSEDFKSIEEETYTELLRILAQYPDITSAAFKTMEPSTIMHYLSSITDQLAVCLETEEGEEKPELSPAEFVLFEATRQVLENGMRLVGIWPVTRDN